ncbi:MAG: phosphoglucosamine mutase [Gemmataceae bacterium]
MSMDQERHLIVSVSGIRGIVGKGLTAEQAGAFASALGTHIEGGRVVLSQDGRPSGAMLRYAIVAGLLETGCEVDDLGAAATPTCGLAIRMLETAGGIQITASHNPAPWNGLKLFGADGRIFPAADGLKVKRIFDSKSFRRVAWNQLGHVRQCSQAEDWHRDRVLGLVDVPGIRAKGLRVFLDANGGAGGPLGCRLLDALGAQPVCQGIEANGLFAHEPEPIEENLREVCPEVVKHRADIGFVLDPDADRLALIDETGRFLGEELTLGLAVLFRLRAEKGPVVINMSTSRAVEDIAARFGVPCHRSAVGEANVCDLMQQVGAVIGGEGNGGVIDPRVGFVRDPFIGMGLILSLMAETDKKVSELAAGLPAYQIVKDKYQVTPDRLPLLFEQLEKRWPGVAVNKRDGLRLDWKDRWIHVRSSNTEPIVRVIAEAPRKEDAQKLCREVGALLA